MNQENFDEIEDMNVDAETYQINTDQLLGKFKSKKALYKILNEHRRCYKSHEYIIVQYYLPIIKGTPLRFLRQLLKGEKKMLKFSELKDLNVPKYPEISVQNLWEKFKNQDDVVRCFPDYTETQQPERKYLIDVLKTIKYDYMVKVVDNAHKARNVERNIEDSQVIEIKPSLLNEMMNTNFNSSTKRRAIFLLKKSANLLFERRGRKTFALLDLPNSSSEEEKKEEEE